jgi:hypothetical protein
MNPANPIPQNNTKSAGTRIEYRNPLNNLFFNVNYRFSDSKRNLISNRNDQGFIVGNYIEQDNHAVSNVYSLEVGKYFPKFKTNASVSYNNTTSKSDAYQNNGAYSSENNAQTYGFKLNNTYFSWMSLDYNGSISTTKQTNTSLLPELIGTSKRNGYNHNLAVFFYPLENHTIGFNWDQVNSSNINQSYNNAFYDISYQFSWAKKKIDFELKWMNIANRKVFETYNVNSTYNEYTKFSSAQARLCLR